MKYVILRRSENGPKDLLRVEGFSTTGLVIKKILIQNDEKMYYSYDSEKDIFYWNCSSSKFFKDSGVFQYLYLNRYDRFFEFEDDSSAVLYFEMEEK